MANTRKMVIQTVIERDSCEKAPKIFRATRDSLGAARTEGPLRGRWMVPCTIQEVFLAVWYIDLSLSQ